MAGFDFDVPCKKGSAPLLRALLDAARRLGKARQCEIRYRQQSPVNFYITADGPLTNLQSLGELLFYNLPPFAEGFAKPVSRQSRLKIAERLCMTYLEKLQDFSDELHEFADQLGGVPNSFFFHTGEATHLKKRLREFTKFLIFYWEGRIGSNQFAEEAHTILELLLKNATRKKKNHSFSQLVDAAVAGGVLSNDYKAVLIKLKDLRKGAKHHGREVPVNKMDELAPKVLSACQILVGVIRSSYRANNGVELTSAQLQKDG